MSDKLKECVICKKTSEFYFSDSEEYDAAYWSDNSKNLNDKTRICARFGNASICSENCLIEYIRKNIKEARENANERQN